MPIEVAPNRIELSTINGGFSPDGEEGALPLDQSPDVLNMLLDPATGSPELRKGFTRLSAGRINSLSASHWIRHVNYYEVIVNQVRKRYLVCILTNGVAASANNIQVWVYDLMLDTFTRVDTAGRSWANAKSEHWFAVVEGTYYGGTRSEVIYSWHPTDGWDADPTTPSVKTWVDAVDGGVTPASQYGRDNAFKKGQKVLYSGKYYSALRGIRFKTWESGERYNKGEKVSVKATTGSTYWRSFVCIKSHTSGAASKPRDGADTATYWKKLRLKNVKDEDGEITSDWAYMPLPGKGVVGVYHGSRMWVRHDDSDNWARLQYSAPAKPEKDALISDLDFRPTDWAPVDDNQGDGGGWMTIPFAHGDAIRGLYSYGSYLLIFGRWQTFVLAGTNEQTWTLRPLSHKGVIGPASMTEHDGLVYYLSLDGFLMRTDGTSSEEVPGFEKVREYIKDKVDQCLQNTTYNWYPQVVSYGGYVIMSFPDPDGVNRSMAYHPKTGSFWLLDIPILDMTPGTQTRTERLYFSTAITGAASQRPCLFVYLDDPGNEVFTDDDDEAVSATASTNDISWNYRTAWFQFGTTRNERRIRRAWALVAGEAGEVVDVSGYRAFNPTAVYTVNRTLTGQATQQAEFVEGKSMQTTYATALKVGGTANAQLALHGFGIDTERVRGRRFHK